MTIAISLYHSHKIPGIQQSSKLEVRTGGGSSLLCRTRQYPRKSLHFLFIEKEIKRRVVKLLYSRLHPILPSQCNGSEARGIRSGQSTSHFLICVSLFMGWFPLAASPEHTVQGVDLTFQWGKRLFSQLTYSFWAKSGSQSDFSSPKFSFIQNLLIQFIHPMHIN